MGTSHHWNWTGAQPLTVNVAQIGLAAIRGARGNAGTLSLFYIATNEEVLNVRQRVAGDSTTWEVQPALSSSAPGTPHVAVKATQFALGEATAGVIDLLVVSTSHEISRDRKSVV